MTKLTIAACVNDRRKQRLQDAVGAGVILLFFESFLEMRNDAEVALASIVILDAFDRHGESSASTFAGLTPSSSPQALILYASSAEISAGAVTAPLTDIILADSTDTPILLKALVTRSSMRFAADQVLESLRARLAGPVMRLAETAIRQPGCTTVSTLADRIGVHRQTLARWCRTHTSIPPEELLVWCRVLLVSALLEHTDYPISALADHLEFPSAIALRNQIKRYTGLTGLEVRAAGLRAVLSRFDGAMASSVNRPVTDYRATATGTT
jgi:AraC-like DNA-binding protein